MMLTVIDWLYCQAACLVTTEYSMAASTEHPPTAWVWQEQSWNELDAVRCVSKQICTVGAAVKGKSPCKTP